MKLTPPQHLVPGTIVTVQMKGLFRLAHHFALVSARRDADSMPMVITNSGDFGGPAEQGWHAFVQGRTYRAFYPGTLPPETVLANAYALFGTRYSFFHWNCEHFANACHGRGAHSQQVRAGLAFAAMVGGIALAAARG